MSQENVELVAASLRDFQATLRATEAAAPDFVWDVSALEGWPDASQYFGPEGFNEFIAKWTEAYDEFEQNVEEVIDAGDQDVVSILSQRARPRGKANAGTGLQNRRGSPRSRGTVTRRHTSFGPGPVQAASNVAGRR
jgi:hypothetical protein